MENADVFQIYSIDLKNVSSVIKLTKDQSLKQNLQLANDNETVFFQTYPLTSSKGSSNLTQQQLYSIDLTNDLIERWATDFLGNVGSYTIKSDGGVYILDFSNQPLTRPGKDSLSEIDQLIEDSIVF